MPLLNRRRSKTGAELFQQPPSPPPIAQLTGFSTHSADSNGYHFLRGSKTVGSQSGLSRKLKRPLSIIFTSTPLQTTFSTGEQPLIGSPKSFLASPLTPPPPHLVVPRRSSSRNRLVRNPQPSPSSDDYRSHFLDGIDQSIGKWISVTSSEDHHNLQPLPPPRSTTRQPSGPRMVFTSTDEANSPIATTSIRTNSFKVSDSPTISPATSSPISNSSPPSPSTPASSQYNLEVLKSVMGNPTVYRSQGAVWIDHEGEVQAERKGLLKVLHDENFDPFREEEEEEEEVVCRFRRQW
jgi:hypothetical protein